MKPARSLFPLVLVLALAGGVAWWGMRRPAPPAGGDTGIPIDRPLGAHPALSELADPPDWDTLNAWQGTISRDDFVAQLESVFTVSPAWRQWFHVGETDVFVETGVPGQRFRLRFAKPGIEIPPPREWQAAADMEPAPEGRPLEDVRIAIDPGHIGGPWARIEERWFRIGDGAPVQEGDMTLAVARLLQPRLEALGAEVSLVRDETEPVTTHRPESLLEMAAGIQPDSPRLLAERLFYRTAEIRARARRVNESLRPDLVLCLHFNAESWGDPANPTLVPVHHFHVLVNGAYTDEEIGLADQRYQAVRKIVEGIHPEEAAIADTVAARFVRETGLPPYLYEIDSKRALNVGNNPYVWARNLLANRLYDCPVLFLEPYVMNSTLDYPRIQAGDYDGLRLVDGRERPSIFREYADAVAKGLADYYGKARPSK